MLSLTSVVTFAKEVKREAMRVVWPSRQEVTGTTLLVLVLVVFFALFFLVADTVIASVVRGVLSL